MVESRTLVLRCRDMVGPPLRLRQITADSTILPQRVLAVIDLLLCGTFTCAQLSLAVLVLYENGTSSTGDVFCMNRALSPN